MNPEHAVGAVVKLICDDLTDDEIAAMNLCIQLGTDPRQAMGYEKAKSLFTTLGHNGIPEAHQLTRDYMFAETVRRLKP